MPQTIRAAARKRDYVALKTLTQLEQVRCFKKSKPLGARTGHAVSLAQVADFCGARCSIGESRLPVHQKCGNLFKECFHHDHCIGIQFYFVERVIHQQYPAISRTLINGKRRVANS